MQFFILKYLFYSLDTKHCHIKIKCINIYSILFSFYLKYSESSDTHDTCFILIFHVAFSDKFFRNQMPGQNDLKKQLFSLGTVVNHSNIPRVYDVTNRPTTPRKTVHLPVTSATAGSLAKTIWIGTRSAMWRQL